MPEREKPKSDISFLDIATQNSFKDVNPFKIANKVKTNLETLPSIIHELWRTNRAEDIYNVIFVIQHEFGQNLDIREFGLEMMYTVAGLIYMGDNDKNVADFVTESLPIWERAYLRMGINDAFENKTAEYIVKATKKIIDGGHTLNEIPKWESNKSTKAENSAWN
jgi:hypothetical protein